MPTPARPFKKLGLTADAVANGREALESLKTLPYDVVLMDVQMPEMDGLEATRQIRNPQSPIPNRNLPVIAMTAHSMQGDKERCLEAGMNDYVAKPISPRALAEALEKWLPKEGAEARTKETEVERQKGEDRGQSFPSIWDRDALLDRMMGDEELAGVIVRGFLADIPKQIAALQGYLDAGDVGGAKRQVHSIKGASANVGGEALRVLASELEQMGKAGDAGSMNIRMEELHQEFHRLKDAMQEG